MTQFFRPTPLQRRNIGKIIPFGFIWFAFAVIYLLLERGFLGDLNHYPSTGNAYEFGSAFIITSICSLLMGWLLGALEILVINRLFVRRSFGAKIVIKTALYLLLICTFIVLVATLVNAYELELSPFDPDVLQNISVFFGDLSFWSLVLYAGAVIGVTLFVSEVSDNLGQGVLKNFLTGKYHQPREEQRIFMFLDMKSSTAIAEQLGHVQYFQMLNKFYADITDAVLQSCGEIYQYVGDEIIISWNMSEGLRDNNCLSCFFLVKDIVAGERLQYEESFGIVPEFKAGLHYGDVSTGELGVIKKEIVFSGDVLNTTSRIQSACKEHEVDLLISNDLLAVLHPDEKYAIEAVGDCELRGKIKRVRLSTVQRTRPHSSP